MGAKSVLARVALEPPIECLQGGTRASVPASALLSDANHWIESTGKSLGTRTPHAGALFSSRMKSHRLIHRIVHSFVGPTTRKGWNNRQSPVL